MSTIYQRINAYVKGPHLQADAVGFLFLTTFSLLAIIISYFLPFGSSKTAVVYLGRVCTAFCLQVSINWFGAIFPAIIAIIILPIGARIFYAGAPPNIRRIVGTFVPVIVAIAGLGQSVALTPLGLGLRFNPLLEVACFLLFSAMLIYPSRILGIPNRNQSQPGRLFGGVCLTFGFWVLIFLWNDLTGLLWFLGTYDLQGSIPLVIGGGGLLDGVLVVPGGLAVGYYFWVVYSRRRSTSASNRAL